MVVQKEAVIRDHYIAYGLRMVVRSVIAATKIHVRLNNCALAPLQTERQRASRFLQPCPNQMMSEKNDALRENRTPGGSRSANGNDPGYHYPINADVN